MLLPNGAHSCPIAEDWKIVADRVRENNERLERMENTFMQTAPHFTGIHTAVNDIRNKILDSAIGRNQVDSETHQAIVKGQARIYGSIIFLLLTVLGVLLIGEKLEFIRMLH